MKRLLKIGLTLGIVVSCIFSSIGVSAMSNIRPLTAPKNLQVTKQANNNYSIQVGNDSIPIGSATTSFTPVVTFPHWQGYAWNASIGLSMAVTSNALAVAGMTSSFTSTSVTASNTYFSITYGATTVKPGFNETGGLDINITIKKNIGNTLAFSYNKTNVNAYLQPSLTKEWTVGQDLGDGRTVASVTDTDVTDNLGNNVAHRPDYVVNSIAFMNATAGGMVSDVQAATGLTTGQIGYLYRMKMTGANGVTAWADWSIPNGTNLWLNLNTTGMTYPIVIAPAGDTFGYTTAGSSAEFGYGSLFFSSPGYTGVSGTGTSITANCSGDNSTAMALYTFDGSTYSLVTNGATNLGSVGGWITANFTSSPTLTATTYYLAWSNAGTRFDYDAIAYNSTGGYTGYSKAMTFGSRWLASFSSPSSIGTAQLSIYCTYTAGGGANISNAPSSIDFGVIQPSTKYYAYGSAPSNPVTDGQCTFTITNGQANAIKVNIQATNFTGGGGWTLGTPDGTHARLIAYYSGENPASGVTLTTSPQTFVASLAGSATIKWDFSWETATAFADGTQKSSTITLTGVSP